MLTIIGAVSFHGPVRDGKGWDRDAMDTRLKGGALVRAVRPGVSAHDSGEVRVLDCECITLVVLYRALEY